MSDLRDSFTYTWLDGSSANLTPEVTGTNNADGSNADDTNWNTSYPSPWNTVVGRWTWTHGGTTHRIVYDRDLGWTSVVTADGSGNWSQSTQSNGNIRWTRISDSAYYEINPSNAWVSGTPPAPSSTPPSSMSTPVITSHSLCVNSNRRWYITITGAASTDVHTVHLGSSLNVIDTLTGNGVFDIGTFGVPVINIKKGSSVKHSITNTPCSKKVHCNFW